MVSSFCYALTPNCYDIYLYYLHNNMMCYFPIRPFNNNDDFSRWVLSLAYHIK